MIAIPLCTDFVVSERFGRMEVENKKQTTLFKHYNFIFFVSQTQELMLGCHQVVQVLLLVHFSVKIIEKLKS